MIDRVAASVNHRLIEVPVGFRWFVEGLIDGSVGFGGEESSGVTFRRRDGTVWTTDKDGIVPNLLAAEITARSGCDPGEHYRKFLAGMWLQLICARQLRFVVNPATIGRSLLIIRSLTLTVGDRKIGR